MTKQLLLILILAVIGFAACNDKEPVSNEQPREDSLLYTIELSNDDSTYSMSDCVGVLSFDSKYECYVFQPDRKYGYPFPWGYELWSTVLLKNIPDTLKAYVDSTLVIAGTYRPICTKIEKGTNCPWVEKVYEGEIKWAAPYKIVYEEDSKVSGEKKK